MASIDSKKLSEKIKLLSNIAEYTISNVPLLVFSEKEYLIARGKGIHVEIKFYHGIEYKAVSIKKAEELFSKFDKKSLLKEHENFIEIRSGRFKGKLVSIDQESSDKIVVQAKEDRSKPLPKDFYDALDYCFVSVSYDRQFSWVLNNFNIKSNQMMTTDKFRFTFYYFEDYHFEEEFCISYDMAKQIKQYKPTEYYLGENFLELFGEDVYLKASRVLEKYPVPNEDIVEAENEMRVDSSLLLSSLDKVSLFSGSLINEKDSIDFNLNGDLLTLSSKNDYGEAIENVKVRSEGEVDIKVNSQYIIEMLRKISGEVLIEIDEDKLLIKGENFVYGISTELKGD